MATRHLELSMHIKLEEKRAQKGLQTAMRRSGHKSEKDPKKKKKKLTWRIRREDSFGVSGYPNPSHLFERAASTSVSR